MHCTHCKLTNHEIANCYRLTGFPSNFKFTKSKRNPRVGRTVAQVETSQLPDGMSTGQYFSPEQSSRLFQPMQDAKRSQQNEQQSDVNVLANCVGIIKPLLDPTTFSLFTHIDSHSWILDSGASEHMTYESSLLFNLTSLPSPIYVYLPNSHSNESNSQGQCFFTS